MLIINTNHDNARSYITCITYFISKKTTIHEIAFFQISSVHIHHKLYEFSKVSLLFLFLVVYIVVNNCNG